MTSIGEAFRRERIKQKLDLQSVSSELKISPRLLQAIEAEDFDKLPGGVLTRSFVRQYARLLGLDEDEISGELQRILEPQAAPAAASQPAPPQPPPGKLPEIPLPRVEAWDAVGEKNPRWSKSLPALAMVVVIMLACSAIYSWLQRPRRSPAPPENASAPVPTASTRPPAVPQNAKPQAAPAPPSEGPTAADRKNEPGADSRAPAAAQPAAAPPSNPAPTAANAAVRVQMTAEEPVWVSVRSDGKYLFSGTLHANESRTAEAGTTMVLRLGNAGGIRISLNGNPIGPVGPKGQIRTLQLTSGGFQILPEVPKSAPSNDLDPL
jgi:cytoskeleton protein RodZ